MKPVFMTKKHKPPESFGNCYAACYASILELPIDAVPPFEMLPGFANDDDRYDTWHDVLEWWLRGMGLGTAVVKHESGQVPFGYAIMSGQSPRFSDSGHCVVVLDGKVVHDPMEGAERITERWDYIKLVPWHESHVACFPAES